MANSQILAFATGVGANVINYTSYNAAAWRNAGFSAGLAKSEYLNTVWRQSSFVAAALAKAVADLSATDVDDDGDLAGLVVQIKAAIAAGGGIASFNTRTGAVTLTIGDVNGAMTGPLLLHGDPTVALGAATKQYVDSYAAGFQPKTAAALATTTSITLSGEQTIDGTLTSTSRVLVKDQAAPAQNGLYTTAAGAWTRATDMDAWSEVPGAQVFVTGGSTNAGKNYYCTSTAGGTLNTTAITFILQSQAQIYTASGGISLSGANFVLTDMAQSTGDTGTGGVQGAVPAPAAGDAAAELYLDAAGGWSSPRNAFIAFAGRTTNGACSVGVERGFAGGAQRTSNGVYQCDFDADIGTTAYGVTISTGQQNCVASYSKATSGVTITIQQGNANVGSSLQNPADITVVIHR